MMIPKSASVPRRAFFQMLGLAVAVVVIFNLAASVLVQRSVPYQLLRRLQDPTPVEGIFLGNSLIVAGLDAGAFQAAWPRHDAALANAGLGWSTPVEHDLLFRYTLARQPKARFVVYGFYDFQMTEPPFTGWNNIDGNKVISYRIEPEHALEMYGVSSWLERWQLRAIRFLPMVAEREWLWHHVNQVRRVLDGLGMPPVNQNRFGDVDAFKAMESADDAHFKAECRAEIDRNGPLVPPMAEIMQLARERNMPIFVVEMPMSPSHRRTFYAAAEWPQYCAHVQALVEQAGGVYIQAGDWIPGADGFMDALHMSEPGSREFSRRLAELLASQVKPK